MGGDGNNPWWVAGIMAAIGVGYALFRLYDFIRHRNSDAARKSRQDRTTELREARRDAATEAWEVVDRQNEEIERLTERVGNIEVRERQCAEERAADKMILKILATWAQKQKNPPPIPADVLAELTGGSSGHPPVRRPPTDDRGAP